MAAKSSLAEKYALRKSQNSDSRNTPLEVISPRYEAPQTPLKTYPQNTVSRKSLAEKYESRNLAKPRDLKIPGAFGSPIKRIYVSPVRKNGTAPSHLYKISKSPRAHKINKLEEYKVGKKASTGTKVGQIARKITGFLASLGSKKPPSSEDYESSRLQNLETKPVKELMSDFRSMESVRTSNFPVALSKAIFPKPSSEDIDEVDLAIRENKHRQEQRRLQNEKRRLEQRLLEESQLAQELKEKYERRLYLQQKDFKAQLHALKEESRTKRREELEELEADQTFSEITPKDLTRQNESLLVQHSRLQEDLEERSRVLAEKEAIIALRERELIAKSYRLSGKVTSPKIDSHNQNSTPRITPSTVQPEKKNEDELQLAQADNSQKLIPDSDSVRELASSINGNVQSLIQVLESSTQLSNASKQEKLTQIQSLQMELQQTQPPKPSSAMKKIMAVETFLNEFDTRHEKNPQEATRSYNNESLEGILEVLHTLRSHLEDKSRLRVRQIKKYDRQLSKMGSLTRLSNEAEISKYASTTVLKTQAILHLQNLTRSQEQINKVLQMVSTIKYKLGAESTKLGV